MTEAMIIKTMATMLFHRILSITPFSLLFGVFFLALGPHWEVIESFLFSETNLRV